MSDKSNKYGYVGVDIPEQSFQSNKGVFNPAEINELVADNKWTQYGQLELIETQNVSAVSSADFTSLGSYNVHFLTISDFTLATDSQQICMRLSTDNGTSFITSGYQHAIQNGYSDGTFSETKSTSQNRMRIAGNFGNGTNENGNAYVYLYNLLDSSKYSFTTSHAMGMHPNATLGGGFSFGSNVLPTSATHNAFQVRASSGNFSADISLYGIKEYS